MVIKKTVSWAIVSYMIIGIATYVGTGMLLASIFSAFFAVALKTPFYTVHEMVWNKLHHVSKAKAEATATTGVEVCPEELCL